MYIMAQYQLLYKADLRVRFILETNLFLKRRQRRSEMLLSVAFPVAAFAMKISHYIVQIYL